MNQRYRCAGCSQYQRRPEYRRLGLQAVCSETCLWKVADRRISRLPRPRQGAGHTDIPQHVRVEVAIRDRCRCRSCGTRAFLEQHHVTYRSQGGPHEPWNLVTLCRCCHALAHTDKHRYQPALRALIWIQYTEGRYLTLPRVEALLATWEIP